MISLACKGEITNARVKMIFFHSYYKILDKNEVTMITISLCMIIKNEGKVLSRCLDSIKDLMDEIIIIDTGSTDNTKEIAKNYTDKIYDFEWIDDFSAARNYSFSKANKDYIYVADADEVLDAINHERFQQLKTLILPEIDIVQMKYITSADFNTVYNFQKEYRPKLFKRVRSFNWISPIHETVNIHPIVYDSDIEVLHLPQTKHTNRDFSTFMKAIHNGYKLENYVLIMFCKELFISGENEDFIAAKDVFIDMLSNENRSEEERKNIACVLARIYRLTGNFNEFFKLCLKDMAANPCAEICMELGEYFYSLHDFEEAVIWFINAANETPSIIDIHTSGDLPLKRLSDCYSELAKSVATYEDHELFDIYISNANKYEEAAREWKLPVE